ncbi:T9SS type A sorting domain-containing protein [candidate division KSB1 bacterium]|nr:T9SS type A sorting domain-containing protein [candidate division KSB1 bacterium]
MARLFRENNKLFLVVFMSCWSMLSAHVIQISWSPNPEPDVKYYHIYRASSISSETNIAQVSSANSVYMDYDIALGHIYYYRIVAVDSAGNSSTFSDPVTIIADIASNSLAQKDVQPAAFELTRIYPNPFNPATTLAYTVAQQANVSLAIYDGRGRKIKTLVEETKSPGFYDVIWDARDELNNMVATGVYFARLICGESQDVRRLVFKK